MCWKNSIKLKISPCFLQAKKNILLITLYGLMNDTLMEVKFKIGFKGITNSEFVLGLLLQKENDALDSGEVKPAT